MKRAGNTPAQPRSSNKRRYASIKSAAVARVTPVGRQRLAKATPAARELAEAGYGDGGMDPAGRG